MRDPKLTEVLDVLVEPLSRGDPESPLRWTCKSTRLLAGELTGRQHPISHEKVAQLLRDMGYSLQGNRKTEEGEDHPDRDAQFGHINQEVRRALARGWPVISVDTKKKELVGNFENKGRQWRRQGTGERVKSHDFPDPSVPRAYPYGIYDLGQNAGFVNVGTDHDTASFAVASIRGWWRYEGRRLYPGVTDLLITADGGGSNGYRLRLWPRSPRQDRRQLPPSASDMSQAVWRPLRSRQRFRARHGGQVGQIPTDSGGGDADNVRILRDKFGFGWISYVKCG